MSMAVDMMKKNILKVASVATVLVMITVSCGGIIETEATGSNLGGEAMASVNSSTPTDFISDSSMAACYSNFDQVKAGSANVYASTAVGVWNGYWLDQFGGRWLYYYKLGGIAYSEGDELIRVASVQINEATGSDHFVIDTVDHSDYVWSCPRSSGTNENLAEVSNLVISIALGLVSNVASIAWSTASTIISLLHSGCDEVTSRDNYRAYAWKWSPDIDKTSQHVSFYALVEPGKTAKLNTEYAVIGPIYELLTTGTFTFTMRAPNTSGTSPADMTIQERQQNGILTIPRDQLQSVAAEMGVPDADVRALMSTDQDEFYFTSSAPECTIAENISSCDPESLMDQESLLEAVTDQIDRSKMIVDALDDDQIYEMDGSAEIVEKNASKLDSLQMMKDRLEKCTLSQHELNALSELYIQLINGGQIGSPSEASKESAQHYGPISRDCISLSTSTTTVSHDFNNVHRVHCTRSGACDAYA